jgi:hypothetical protein
LKGPANIIFLIVIESFFLAPFHVKIKPLSLLLLIQMLRKFFCGPSGYRARRVRICFCYPWSNQ